MKNFKKIVLGMLIATVYTIVFLVIFSLVLVNNNVDEKYICPCVIVILSSALFLGAMVATKNIQKNGAMYGVAMSAMYLMVMFLISSIIIGNFSIGKQSIYMIMSALMLGCAGGIIGVNIK